MVARFTSGHQIDQNHGQMVLRCEGGAKAWKQARSSWLHAERSHSQLLSAERAGQECNCCKSGNAFNLTSRSSRLASRWTRYNCSTFVFMFMHCQQNVLFVGKNSWCYINRVMPQQRKYKVWRAQHCNMSCSEKQPSVQKSRLAFLLLIKVTKNLFLFLKQVSQGCQRGF